MMRLFKPTITATASTPTARAFSTAVDPTNLRVKDWENMTAHEKCNYALAMPKPTTSDIALYQGLGFLQLGNEFYPDALNAFAEAIKMDPHCTQAFLGTARVYAEIKDWPKVTETLKNAVGVDTDLIDLFSKQTEGPECVIGVEEEGEHSPGVLPQTRVGF